jgi:hypothetical protein
MLQLLFNSQGRPIAYFHEDMLFKYHGKFLGWLEDGEFWIGRYLGEIVGKDRLFFHEAKDGGTPVANLSRSRPNPISDKGGTWRGQPG